jgi:prevent-host-death family protein
LTAQKNLYPIRALAPEPVTGDERIPSALFHGRPGYYLWRVSNGHQVLIVTNNDRPVAAVIPVQELERLRVIERELRLLKGKE